MLFKVVACVVVYLFDYLLFDLAGCLLDIGGWYNYLVIVLFVL